MMEPRLDFSSIAPETAKLMMEFEKYIQQSDLDTTLLELVKVRAAQINGCAFCLDMHTKDARADGETEMRLYTLDAWRETNFYTERERAALELTEAVTKISENHIPEEQYNLIKEHFNDKDFIDLLFAINTINNWNRIAITTRMVPGVYQPKGK